MMFNTFERQAEWEGKTYDFIWPEGDTGLWDGPLSNWRDSHVQTIRKYCKQYNIVVQAGGAAGMYPLFLSTMFKTVYTFEPEALNFHCLVNNCQQSSIIKINAAVGDKHFPIRMNMGNPVNVGTHTTTYDPNGHIPSLLIDDLGLHSCDLIMLDIEGFENYAIKGAELTIARFKPVIFAENGGDLMSFLERFGYRCVGNSIADTIYVPIDS